MLFPTSDLAAAVGHILECPTDVAEDHVRRYPEDSARLAAHFPEIYRMHDCASYNPPYWPFACPKRRDRG